MNGYGEAFTKRISSHTRVHTHTQKKTSPHLCMEEFAKKCDPSQQTIYNIPILISTKKKRGKFLCGFQPSVAQDIIAFLHSQQTKKRWPST